MNKILQIMNASLILSSAIILFSLSAALSSATPALAFSLYNPERKGAGINLGTTHDPDPTFQFSQLTFSALYDYEQIMGHRAPEPLKFRLEANLGLADPGDKRVLASFNFYALYYLEGMAAGGFRPYVEAGAGIIYTDFQVEGQGLRWNFNPQAGAGLECHGPGDMDWYAAIHLTHISNGGLHSDNRGINGVLFQLGYLF